MSPGSSKKERALESQTLAALCGYSKTARSGCNSTVLAPDAPLHGPAVADVPPVVIMKLPDALVGAHDET